MFLVITVLSSFIAYHRVCNKNDMTGDTSGAGTADPFRAPKFNAFRHTSYEGDIVMVVL
jgi:hypothetical protein